LAEQRHVTYNPDARNWRVVGPHAERASAVAQTQGEAIGRAREILRNAGGCELLIHRPNGEIRGKDTIPPGNDPFPSRG
jgi:hypothetical protein